MSFSVDADASDAERPIIGLPQDAGTGSRPPVLGWGSAALMIAGGLLTGCLVAAILATGARGNGDVQLLPVARAELAAASQSLLPAQAAALIADAESCRVPLAVLTIRASGAPRGIVRIRSGGYTSPNLQLGLRPDRMAVPYPAPYALGRGQIAIESAAEGVDVFLTPGVHIGAGNRSTVINVRWNPRTPC